MSRNRIVFGWLAGACLAAFCALSAHATEWFVDWTRPDNSGNGKSVEAAKRTIQAAVGAASAGDVVTVLPGVYDEGSGTFTSGSSVSTNRVYITKNLTLRSRDGAATTHIVGAKDLTVAQDAEPWGMGSAAVRCIAVSSSSSITQVSIEGFTIRDGATAFGGDSTLTRGGGILNLVTSPGVQGASRIIVSNCVVRGNTGTRGGGAYGIKAVDCVFTENRASTFGAAVRQCNMERCLVYRNGTLKNASVSVIAYGYSIVNCTVAYNETLDAFYNFDADGASVSNCICVANAGCGVSRNIYTSITDAGEKPNGCVAVTSGDRLFVAPAAGDFRLRAEGHAVTKNPLSDGMYCGAVQEAVSCAGSGYLEFSTATGGTMFVDGVPVRSSVYAFAAPWPRSYAVTFEPDAGNGLVNYQYASSACWPTTNEVYYVLPPVSGNATVSATTGTVRYVSPQGDDEADGTAGTPWRTLQGAMDAIERDNIVNALVYVHPGRYDEGGKVATSLSNRVVFASGHAVRLKALEGPERTFIVGAADSAPVVPNDLGLGPHAMRCVAFLGAGNSVQGFTLTGGHSSIPVKGVTAGTDTYGGACVSYTSTSVQPNSGVLDCVISNNAASRGAAALGPRLERCLIAENSVAEKNDYADAGQGLLRMCWVRSSIVTRNRAVNSSIGQTARAFNVTVVSNYCSGVHTYNNSGYATNTVYAYNVTGDDIGNKPSIGWSVYEDGNLFPNCIKETTLFADYLNGDFRPYAASAGTFFGDPSVFANGSCFADFNGKPFPIGPNGRITAGAVSDLVPSVKVVSPVPGGTDVEGVVTEFPVTVTATCAERQLLGFEVNGAIQAVEGRSVTITADQATGFTSFTVSPVYGTDWWVDATNGNDANTGWSAASAKKTLAGAMSLTLDGDTVHALPGVYDEGTMLQDNPPSYDRGPLRSRVVVQTNVTLVAEGAVDETVIQGARGNGSGDTPELFQDAVRCVYLNSGAKVKGFTIRDGHTDSYNNGTQHAGNSGGGVIGRSWNDTAVEDCIVTNCNAVRGGAGYTTTFRRCRIVGNHAASSPVGRYLALYGCYVADNLGRNNDQYNGLVQNHYDIVGCTFTSGNGIGTSERTSGSRLSVAQNSNRRFWNNVIDMAYGGNYRQTLSNACHNVFSDALLDIDAGDILQGEDNVITNSEAIALGADGVPLYGSVAIDASSFEYVATNLTGETGLNGVWRGLGGGVDIGAFEFDWLPRFAQDLGGKGLVVTAADNAVFENDDGLVEIPSGSLALAWTPATQSASCPCIFKANVTGNGTLTVTKGGEVLGTYAAGMHEVNFFGSGTIALAFAYEPGADDTGGAVLSGFVANIGTVMIFR